ncbi:MAG: CBS domain-containing protein [Patulibacter sp.]|nr:CBS domain-containing protein [Patulibacter sp.]MDO9409141.1 CBS domain-containing protein [Patulibacter sp.]
MSPLVVEVGPGHTLRQAARLMAERNVGAAIVMDPDGEGPGILTERDVLRAVAAGEDPSEVLVSSHVTTSVVYAEPSWSLDDAAAAMVDGGFRHLVVLEGPELQGVLSVRDITRAWAKDRGLLGDPGAGPATAKDADAVAIS